MNIHLNMKSSLQSLSTFLLVLATSGATLVPATAVAGSAVVRGDFNNDGKEDIFAVRDGEYSVRANAAEAGEPMQALSFLTPPLYLNPDTVKVADIDQDGFDDVLLASRQANRLLVIYGQAVLGGVWRTSEFLLTGGPVGADAAQFISGGALEILSPLNALPQPNSTMLNAAGASIQAYALPSLAGSWTSVDVAAARCCRSIRCRNSPGCRVERMASSNSGGRSSWPRLLARRQLRPPITRGALTPSSCNSTVLSFLHRSWATAI
jgi:hypothetical protein